MVSFKNIINKSLNHINNLNKNKFFIGIIMIISNVAPKYTDLGFSKAQKLALRNTLSREILIFTAVFIGTNDIITSILMTAAFMILSNHILNENSRFCIIPNKYRKLKEIIDIDGDDEISDEEARNAINILTKALQNKNKNVNKQVI
tara:strand:+ start:511 stop:951 length:441 start_codon:yes stop_codon:yes gene_type:complete